MRRKKPAGNRPAGFLVPANPLRLEQKAIFALVTDKFRDHARRNHDTLRPPALARYTARCHRRHDDSGQQPRQLEQRVRLSVAQRVGRVHADRSGISLLPVHSRRLDTLRLSPLRLAADAPDGGQDPAARCGDMDRRHRNLQVPILRLHCRRVVVVARRAHNGRAAAHSALLLDRGSAVSRPAFRAPA